VSTARIPVATYRLQFNAGFTFVDARNIAGYLSDLGISDCYASSYLRAVPGSLHGYDVADPTHLNPEIGSEEDYAQWVSALSSRGMGHILDLVPNHMGIAQSANPWWMDVLENGPSSRFAHFFDIEWRPVKDELADKVLIPILGDQYGAALERQELKLTYRDGAFIVQYYENWLPIATDSFADILTHGLEPWLRDAGQQVAADELDELQSVATAAGNLPPRASRDPGAIAERAREKEIIKRRLASLLDRSSEIRQFVDDGLARFNGIVGDPRSFDLLDHLLNKQSYRLAHWRVASEEINYRRFFDVNQLAALRMEDPSVFDEVHRFAFELVGRGAATGLRVDHVDGLYAPGDYLRRLQARAAEALGNEAAAADNDRAIYVVVEKILGPDEQPPQDWAVHGTTGYEFAAMVNGLFVDRRREREMDDAYSGFVYGRRTPIVFDDIVYRSKKQVLHEIMSGDINSLGHRLNRFSERNRHFRDFTLYSLISMLKEVIACFPVYRSYITQSDPVTEPDRRYISLAMQWAKRRARDTPPLVFDFTERLLLSKDATADAEEEAARAAFIGKFQQLTGPVAAKGIEDSAFYVYNRLLSLNEVGGDPTRFGVDPDTAHHWLADRQRRWPAGLSATATHDTKRGEDLRARLNVLSEMPDEWRLATVKWRALNRRFKNDVRGRTVPDANEEYFIYQTLVGVWPFSQPEEDGLTDRVKAYLTKALREAKVHTSWLNPDEEYERAVLDFVDAILDPDRPFLEVFRPFQVRVAELGIYNSLAQLLIKITAPGVPDFYQGTELWDLSLVDPDNRRPVDYAQRATLLDDLKTMREPVDALLAARNDGRIKLVTTTRALHARAAMREVYERGDYVPLRIVGDRHDSVFAFARRYGGQIAVTCVPRLVSTLLGDRNEPPINTATWGDTSVELPPEWGALRLRHVFTDSVLDVEDGSPRLAAATIFERYPVALLITDV
jgi:(1->4)-alpha-D-glucan 1-alpha-D-glucosylmutase